MTGIPLWTLNTISKLTGIKFSTLAAFTRHKGFPVPVIRNHGRVPACFRRSDVERWILRRVILEDLKLVPDTALMRLIATIVKDPELTTAYPATAEMIKVLEAAEYNDDPCELPEDEDEDVDPD
jgi:hypothetical protein